MGHGLRSSTSSVEVVVTATIRRITLFSILVLSSACFPPVGHEGASRGQADQAMTFTEFVFETVLFCLVGLFMYYLLVLKPDRERADSRRKFLEQLKKNDEVRTSGGLIGRVVAVRPEFITLEVAQGVKVRVLPDHVQPMLSETKGSVTGSASGEKREG